LLNFFLLRFAVEIIEKKHSNQIEQMKTNIQKIRSLNARNLLEIIEEGENSNYYYFITERYVSQ